MWQELKDKVIKRKLINHPMRVKWWSDGNEGEGTLTDMGIHDSADGFAKPYIEFTICDDRPDVGEFIIGSVAEYVGMNADVNGMRISARYMGEIVILPDKKEELIDGQSDHAT